MVYIDRVRFGIYSTSAVSGDWLKMLLKRDEGMYTVYTVYYEARSLQNNRFLSHLHFGDISCGKSSFVPFTLIVLWTHTYLGLSYFGPTYASINHHHPATSSSLDQFNLCGPKMYHNDWFIVCICSCIALLHQWYLYAWIIYAKYYTQKIEQVHLCWCVSRHIWLNK